MAGPDGLVRAALDAQERRPDHVVEAGGSLREGLRAALATGADHVWLLDGTVAPRPRALGELLAARGRVTGWPEAPVLLAGVVFDGDGAVDETRLPRYRASQVATAIVAADWGLLPVRATAGPALVTAEGVRGVTERATGPLSPVGTLELTARLLRDATGYLVPKSEGDALGPVRPSPPEVVRLARLLAGRSLVGADRVIFGYDLALRAGARVRALRSGTRPPAR